MRVFVLGKDTSATAEWSANHPGTENFVSLVENPKRRSLAAIANTLIDSMEGLPDRVVGFLHADTYLAPGAFQAFKDCSLNGSVCGIVGRDPGKGNRWSKNLIDVPGLVWSLRPGPVSTLDACSIFFRRDLGLRFDSETFDGLHCWVEDLCLQAQAKGIRVEVPFADADHRGDSTFQPAWQAEYLMYRTRLGQKWAGTAFETT